MRRILLLGAGRIGSQVGCEFALHGSRVSFFARNPDRAREQVASAFALAVRAGLCSAAEADSLRAGIDYVETVESGAADRDVIFEAVAEDLRLKGELLGAAAAASPGALLATGTSSLRVTDVGEAAGASERMVGIHYLNPPLLMGLVEVVRGEQTTDATVAEATRLVEETGKTPLVLERDVRGFAWNRLQLAVLREGARLVEEGVVTSEGVDQIMREGLARRWRHVGPLAAVALGGVDTWNEIARNVLPDLSTAQELDDLRGVLPRLDDPAAVVARRDEGLIADLDTALRERS
jgi:3-hydroxyacyl-CoA dehydrogenase